MKEYGILKTGAIHHGKKDIMFCLPNPHFMLVYTFGYFMVRYDKTNR